MGENNFSTGPVALYGVVLLMSAVAYTILARALIRRHGPDSTLAVAIGRDAKGRVSLAAYAAAIPLAFACRWIAVGLYVGVAILWLIPDPRIEKQIA